MQRYWLKLYTTIALIAGLSAVTTVVGHADEGERHPPLHHAIVEVERAVTFMEHANHAFGGHRESAVVMCNAAAEQLREALRWAHVPVGSVPSWENPEKHPMRRAILALEAAKDHLEHARHHFGGHRECALVLCDGAIKQLREALEYEKR